MIQQETDRVAARPSAGQQHQGYLAVVILGTLRLVGADGALQASRTVAAVAGMAFVAIQDGHAQPAMIRQDLVALQPVVDVMNAAPQTLGIHAGGDASHAVGAGHRLAQPAPKEDGVSGQFQSVEAAHAGPEQNRDAFDDAGDRDTRLPAPVRDTLSLIHISEPTRRTPISYAVFC